MHELSHKPPDYGSSERTSLFPSRPTVKHRSHSLQRKAWLGRVASFRSDGPCELLWRSRDSCVIAVSALFEPSVRAQTIERSFHSKRRPTRGGHAMAGQRAGEHAAVDGRRALPRRDASLLVERAGAP
jgi:hypothetical protein